MTTSENLGDWDRLFALRTVEGVNRLRARLGLSIPALRDELAAKGWDLGIDTLNGILSSKKRKSFTVGEMLCFAAALQVPPEYLLLGLPSVEQFPTSPFAPHASTLDAFRWFRGTSESVYSGSLLHYVALYSRRYEDLRRENAIWHINGEPRLVETRPTGWEIPAVHDLIESMRRLRQQWVSELERGTLLPDIPILPRSLEEVVADSGRPLPDAPLQDLLDDKILAVVNADMDAWADAKRHVERMDARANGQAADTAE